MSSENHGVEFGAPRLRAWSTQKIELRTAEIGQGVFAREAIAAGEVLIALAHVFVGAPERHTIQIDGERHQAGTGEIDDYLNHCCEPNARLDAERLCFVAARAIAPGEELTFNYLTSEWDMAEAFDCRCGAERCLSKIRGFRHLPADEQDRLLPLLTPFLRGLRGGRDLPKVA